MKNDQPESKESLFELVKKLWSPIASFLGAIMLIYSFYKLWQGDQTAILYFLAGGGFIILVVVLIFIITRKKTIFSEGPHPFAPQRKEIILFYPPVLRRIAFGGLGLVFAISFVGILLLFQHRQAQEIYLAEQEKKLIVLIAAFEGPEDVYGLRNQIIESLNADFSDNDNVQIVLIDEVVTLTKGSDYARQLGKDYSADIVVWGWYRPTENPNITIHIENLSLEYLTSLKQIDTSRSTTTLADLESFSFQQQAGQETSVLISFLTGFVDYEAGNYEQAIKSFDRSLQKLPETPLLFDNQFEIYFYRGNSNAYLENYELSIVDYNEAIKFNINLEAVYLNRGNAYNNLSKNVLAISDYDHAIEINPKFAPAFNNRGNAYYDLLDYESAIENYDLAIQINPQYLEAYNNRGNAYIRLGDNESAIQEFDQAIQVSQHLPQTANLNLMLSIVYLNRGEAYENMGNMMLQLRIIVKPL